MAQLPLASICIPLYNKGPFIAKTLDAVLRQTYANLEVVVSDNGSGDGSTEIAQGYASRDPRVKYHHLRHTVSMNENWRHSLLLSKGEFVNLHSADDHTIQPDFLEKMTAPLLLRPEIGFTVCQVTPVIVHTPAGLTGEHLARCFRSVATLCKDLANTPDRAHRARKLLVSTSVENFVGTPFAAVCRRNCLPFSHWKKTAFCWPEAYPDWDIMIRLFLNHRAEFVEDLAFRFHFDAGSPYWRTQVDNRTALYDEVWRMLLPLTILSDPDLAELRVSARPEELDSLFNHFTQRLVGVVDKSNQVAAFDGSRLAMSALQWLPQAAEDFRRQPGDAEISFRFRRLRNGLVRHWLDCKPDEIAGEYAGPHGQAQRLFLESGLQRFPLDEYETSLMDEATRSLAADKQPSDRAAAWLALLLLTDLRQIADFSVESLPSWLRTDCTRFVQPAKT